MNYKHQLDKHPPNEHPPVADAAVSAERASVHAWLFAQRAKREN